MIRRILEPLSEALLLAHPLYAVCTAVALAIPLPFTAVPLEHTHPGELVEILVIGGPLVQKYVEVKAGTDVLGLSASGKN
jgi:hypothetical protein